jgi:hypothetical protein
MKTRKVKGESCYLYYRRYLLVMAKPFTFGLLPFALKDTSILV